MFGKGTEKSTRIERSKRKLRNIYSTTIKSTCHSVDIKEESLELIIMIYSVYTHIILNVAYEKCVIVLEG